MNTTTRPKYIYGRKADHSRRIPPPIYDKQLAEQMLTNGFYCHKYRIKMSNRLSCRTWANSYSQEIGPLHEECIRCPHYEHVMNLMDYNKEESNGQNSDTI